MSIVKKRICFRNEVTSVSVNGFRLESRVVVTGRPYVHWRAQSSLQTILCNRYAQHAVVSNEGNPILALIVSSDACSIGANTFTCAHACVHSSNTISIEIHVICTDALERLVAYTWHQVHHVDSENYDAFLLPGDGLWENSDAIVEDHRGRSNLNRRLIFLYW